jgi:outer membrane protein insertion porin family
MRTWAFLAAFAVASWLGGDLRAQDEADEAAPSAPGRVGTVVVEGSADAPGRIEALVALVAPIGSPFVEPGPADEVGTPIATVPRIVATLKAIGYGATVETRNEGGSVQLIVRLRPIDRLRQVFVHGNHSLLRGPREEQVFTQLSLRPGQAMPPSGPERDAFLQSEAARVRDFLHAQGYLDAEVRIELRSTQTVPAQVNMHVRIKLGSSYPLGPVSVSGNTAMDSEEIGDRFRHNWLGIFAKPFRRSTLRLDLTSLTESYRQLGYPGVRITDDFNPETSVDREAKNVRLSIKVRERRRVEVQFSGNRSHSAATLQGELTLFSRGAYDDVEAKASAEALERYYRERGHMLVVVKWHRERSSAEADRLVFTIDEGPVLKVRGVSFVGNHVLSEETLREEIRTNEFPFLGSLGLGAGGYASLRQLELDVQSLVDHYEAVGYPGTKVSAEIAPRTLRWQPLPKQISRSDEDVWRQSDAIFVRFRIEEAPLLWISDMTFENQDAKTALPRDELFFRESMRTVLGAAYEPAVVRRDEERLKRLLGNEGYRQAKVVADVKREGQRVRIVWKIDLGPQVRVGPVFLRGNFLTLDDTIMTWAELRPGDVLTTRAVERAQRNLAMIQLFNNPNPISFPSVDSEQAVVPMVVEVEERHDHYGVVKVGGGISTDQKSPTSNFPVGWYVALGYEHRNLFGHGWTLTSQGSLGPTLTSVTSGFLDPRFFGSLFRLSIDGSYFQTATVRLGDLREGRASIGFAREMYSGVDASVRYNLRDTLRTEYLARISGALDDEQSVRIGTIVGSFSAGVDWQRLDNPLVPTRGFKLSAGVEVALPGLSFDRGHDTFVKVMGRSLIVVPLLRWLTLRDSIRYDQGLPVGSSMLPKVERFFAGGDTSIRGYELDRVLTEVVLQPNGPGYYDVDYRPVGGNLRILHNLELQFPISAPWYGAVFLDSGVVAFSMHGLSAIDFRHGVGIAPFVFKLPIGDLSLSFAIPVNPRPGDASWRFHLNVGLMF